MTAGWSAARSGLAWPTRPVRAEIPGDTIRLGAAARLAAEDAAAFLPGVTIEARRPSMLQAMMNSGVFDSLRAVKEANSTDVPAVMDATRGGPPDDPVMGRGTVRPDGPAGEAFRPRSEGGCPLVR